MQPNARPPMSYSALCHKAADDLIRTMRENPGSRVYLRAWPSTPLQPGILFVEIEGRPIPPDPYAADRLRPALPPVIRPATYCGRWEASPISSLFDTVWHACWEAPIMAPGDFWDSRDDALAS